MYALNVDVFLQGTDPTSCTKMSDKMVAVYCSTGPLSIGQGSATGCTSHSQDTMTAGDFVHSCNFIFTFYIILISKSLLPKYFTVFKFHTCIKMPQNNNFGTFLTFFFFFFYNLQLHKQTICNVLANKMEHNTMLNEVHLCFKVIYKNT